MDLELRELERASISLIPKTVMMESKTVLTQYIISKWSLEYKTESKGRVQSRENNEKQWGGGGFHTDLPHFLN